MNKVWGVFFLSVCAFCTVAFVEPHYSGVFDFQYSGIFKLSDYELLADFPLDSHHRMIYETHLVSGNVDWARQFYVDIDPLLIPGSIRLGKFTIPFGQERKRLSDRPFISSRIIYDLVASDNTLIIPLTETGIGFFHNTRPFSANLFYSNVNGGSAKMLGGDCRFLIKDMLDAGFSLIQSDQLFIAGTDFHLPAGFFDLAIDYQSVSGTLVGKSFEGVGSSAQILYAFDPRLVFGGQYSMYRQTGGSEIRRVILNATYKLGNDMKLRLEYVSNELPNVNNVLQAQCLLVL